MGIEEAGASIAMIDFQWSFAKLRDIMDLCITQ
jgi:hypothetical protein